MRTLPRFFTRAVAALMIFTLSSQAALAQSVLRDAETEALLHELSAPLVAAAGMDPRNVDVVLVGDPSINAFVAGGQVIYINEGLIEAADSAAEVQGVIAHELGHITGGHAINDGGSKAATGISILSLILGGLAAAAG
ncbi:MAG: M48 family metallopeptidase, partial [Novosphingobium sp.]